VAAEVRRVGQRADDSVSGGAVWVGHQALMSALWCSNGAPHLEDTGKSDILNLQGPSGPANTLISDGPALGIKGGDYLWVEMDRLVA